MTQYHAEGNGRSPPARLTRQPKRIDTGGILSTTVVDADLPPLSEEDQAALAGFLARP